MRIGTCAGMRGALPAGFGWLGARAPRTQRLERCAQRRLAERNCRHTGTRPAPSRAG
jgi:hypothetical protein